MKAIKLNGEFISATDVVALASKLDIDCLSCQTHLFDTAIMILVGNGYTIGMYKDTLVITNQRSVVLNSDLLQTIDRLKKQIAELEADNAEFRQLIRDWSIVLEQDDYFQLWHVESVRQAMLEINKEREYIAELEAESERLSQLLHDEMSQLEIATDLGNKRWAALNKIYEDGEKRNTNWCKRIAQEGLGLK